MPGAIYYAFCARLAPVKPSGKSALAAVLFISLPSPFLPVCPLYIKPVFNFYERFDSFTGFIPGITMRQALVCVFGGILIPNARKVGYTFGER